MHDAFPKSQIYTQIQLYLRRGSPRPSTRWAFCDSESGKRKLETRRRGASGMATGGEHAAAAAAVDGEHGELLAPNGWTKKLNPIHGGKFEVVFVSENNEEFKSKRALSKYLSANPGGPRASEFNWGMGNTPRRSSRISEKAKATESPEDEKPPKRERSSSSKRGKKGKQEEDAPAETEDHAKAKDTDVEMKDADSAQEEKKEADDTQEEMKQAENAEEEEKEANDAQEEKKEADDAPEEMKQADVAEEKNEADVAQEEMKQAGNAEEEKKEAPDTDAAQKTEDEPKAEVSEVPSEVLAPVTEKKGDEKLAESEVAPVEGMKDENGPAIESAVPPPVSSQENKEEADSTINPATPPPVETKVDVPAAEAAKDENSADNAAHKDGQVDAASGEQSTANCDNKGQIQPGASTVKCT